MAYSQDLINAYRAVAILTLLLSFYGSLVYVHHGHESETPFTASYILLYIYWVVAFFWQAVFVIASFIPNEPRLTAVLQVGWHFPVFNVLNYVWAESFTSGYFFTAELFLILNFFNLLSMYFNHKTYSLSPFIDWWLIHVPLVAIPLSWVVYAIFWNGAVMFNVEEKLWARILANIFIWDFFLLGIIFVYLFRDWASGLSTSYLMLALGFGQLGIKAFALQWIFAFVIAGLVFCASAFVMITDCYNPSVRENQPLLQDLGV